MKKISFIMMAFACMIAANVCAQDAQVFIKITNENFRGL